MGAPEKKKRSSKPGVKNATSRKPAPKKAPGASTELAQRGPVASSGLVKEYLKAKEACKVTFRLPRVAAPEAKSVCIVGDFNNWSIHAHPMTRLKNGDYTITLDLKPGKEYQFRYLIDDIRWENDWRADKYVRSPYGDSDNSVVIV
jgi:1,4-alpha-glucan branching enzyme